MKKLDFDKFIKDTEGNVKPGDPLNKHIAQYLEGYSNYENGDKAAMWSLIGEIRRKGEVELEENEVEMLEKYWKQVTKEMNVRLDIEMMVDSILKLDGE